jgi:hypothetical protein
MSDEHQSRRSTDGLSIKLDLLHDDVRDMKTALKDLTVAINRLAVVEERQTQFSESVGRAFVSIEDVKLRVSALEVQAVTSSQTNTWAGKAVWAAVTVCAVFISKKAGLL